MRPLGVVVLGGGTGVLVVVAAGVIAFEVKASWVDLLQLVLIFLVVSTVLLVFIDAGVIAFEVKASWVDLLQLVLITVIGAYFGGRSLEKVKK